MEDPATWDLLTSSLAACKLDNPHRAWAFLVLQHLVRDNSGDRESFCQLLRQEIAEDPVIGPSLAARLADALAIAGIALPPAQILDPGAETAKERKAQIDDWFPKLER